MKRFNPYLRGQISINGQAETVAVIGEEGSQYIIGALPGRNYKLIQSNLIIRGRQTCRIPKKAVLLIEGKSHDGAGGHPVPEPSGK